MKLKANVEIVTGFLESGKTTFINALMENTLVKGEKLMIIQCEQGEQVIDEHIIIRNDIIVKQYEPQKCITKEYLEYIMSLYNPHRIIIEHNGSRNLEELLVIFDENELIKKCKVTTIYNIIDACTFELYINNMGVIILDSIYNSNLIVINNKDNIEKEKLTKIITQMKSYNLDAFILTVSKITEITSVLKEEKLLNNGYIKKINTFIRNLL